MKKVLLLFPPEWVPTAPYLALPSITAVLRQNGIAVVQKDINVEMYDMFFSRSFLEHVSGRIAHELRHLQRVGKERALDEEEKALKEQLLQCTPERFDQIGRAHV